MLRPDAAFRCKPEPVACKDRKPDVGYSTLHRREVKIHARSATCRLCQPTDEVSIYSRVVDHVDELVHIDPRHRTRPKDAKVDKIDIYSMSASLDLLDFAPAR